MVSGVRGREGGREAYSHKGSGPVSQKGCRLCRIPGATLKWLVSGSEQTCGFRCNRVWCGYVFTQTQ